MALAVDKMDGCGPSSTVYHEHLPKKAKTMLHSAVHFICNRRDCVLVASWSTVIIKTIGHIHSDAFY